MNQRVRVHKAKVWGHQRCNAFHNKMTCMLTSGCKECTDLLGAVTGNCKQPHPCSGSCHARSKSSHALPWPCMPLHSTTPCMMKLGCKVCTDLLGALLDSCKQTHHGSDNCPSGSKSNPAPTQAMSTHRYLQRGQEGALRPKPVLC